MVILTSGVAILMRLSGTFHANTQSSDLDNRVTDQPVDLLLL